MLFNIKRKKTFKASVRMSVANIKNFYHVGIEM